MLTHGHPTSIAPEREIVLSGELDIASVPALETALAESRRAGTSVALDLSRVTFIDLCAVRAVLNGALAASLAGQAVTIVSPSPAVERVLVFMRVEGLVPTRAAGRPGAQAAG